MVPKYPGQRESERKAIHFENLILIQIWNRTKISSLLQAADMIQINDFWIKFTTPKLQSQKKQMRPDMVNVKIWEKNWW